MWTEPPLAARITVTRWWLRCQVIMSRIHTEGGLRSRRAAVTRRRGGNECPLFARRRESGDTNNDARRSQCAGAEDVPPPHHAPTDDASRKGCLPRRHWRVARAAARYGLSADLEHYITLHHITLYYSTLRYVTLRYVSVRYITSGTACRPISSAPRRPNTTPRQVARRFCFCFLFFLFGLPSFFVPPVRWGGRPNRTDRTA